MDSAADLVSHAIARARAAGAYQADAALSESESFESRVRGSEIDFVKQSRERGLGIRVFYGGRWGLSSASTRTQDLSREVIARTAADAVALARATAPDPCAGLPDGGFAGELPDLELFEPRDRPFEPATRIAAAREMESAAHAFDPRIGDSEGSQVDSSLRLGHLRQQRRLRRRVRVGAPLAGRRVAREGRVGHAARRLVLLVAPLGRTRARRQRRPARGRARAPPAGRAQGADLRSAGDLRRRHRAGPRARAGRLRERLRDLPRRELPRRQARAAQSRAPASRSSTIRC